jgi:hypothetical protein
MELKQELELYRKALIDFENKAKYTNTGFCCYFFLCYDIFTFDDDDFELNLPYLYKQKPNDNTGYWFLCGYTEPRTECLKKAIAEIETILNK